MGVGGLEVPIVTCLAYPIRLPRRRSQLKSTSGAEGNGFARGMADLILKCLAKDASLTQTVRRRCRWLDLTLPATANTGDTANLEGMAEIGDERAGGARIAFPV